MSKLREAAQAALKEMEHANAVLLRQAGVGIIDMNAITNLRAALSAPDDAGPGMWMNRYGATMKTRDRVTANAMGFTIPFYTHPPRDEWRDAVHDELVTTWTFTDKNKDDPRLALRDIINWHVRVALDPAVSSDAQALIDKGRAMRDVPPPTEGA